MKHLLIIFLFTTTITPYIAGMKRRALAQPLITSCYSKKPLETFENRDYSLFVLAKNIHTYISPSEPTLLGDFIWNVSQLNRRLYELLDQERNDPIITRTKIINLAAQWAYPQNYIGRYLRTPGVQTCINYTNQLRNKDLDKNMIDQLCNDGALPNYYKRNFYECLFTHWCTEETTPNTLTIITDLFELGAQPTAKTHYILLKQSLKEGYQKKAAILIKYKPAMSANKLNKIWCYLLKKEHYHGIIPLIDSLAQEDLNSGLICYVQKTKAFMPAILEKFIANGANPSVALPYLTSILTNNQPDTCYSSANQDIATSTYKFLCQKGAYNEAVLIQLKNKQGLIASLINQLESTKLHNTSLK